MHVDSSGRVDTVDKLLECIARIMPASVARKDRKELTKRTDTLLEDLDKEAMPAWLASPWTEDQAATVMEASEALWAQENATGASSSSVAGVVARVLTALEQVAASHVDKAEALLASMQDGETEEVVTVLEHGLAVLEKLSVSSSRKERKKERSRRTCGT